MHCFILCLNYMIVPLVLYHPPLLRQCIALFAVAERWLLLDIGWFVLFMYSIVLTIRYNLQCPIAKRLRYLYCHLTIYQIWPDTWLKILCSYFTALREIYRNVCSEVPGNPRGVIFTDAEGGGKYNISGIREDKRSGIFPREAMK